MRRLYFLFCLFVLFAPKILFGGNDGISFSEVVDMHGITKQELYNRARYYLIDDFEKLLHERIKRNQKEGAIIYRLYIDIPINLPRRNKTTRVMVEYTLAISIRPQKYKIDAFDFKIVKGDPNLLGYFITTSELCPNYSAEWKSSKKRDEIQYIWNTAQNEVDIFIRGKMQKIKEKMATELPPEGSW